MNTLPLVLVVEDNECMRRVYEGLLRNICRPVFASTIDEAMRNLNTNIENLSAVVLDGSLSRGGGELDTASIIRYLRSNNYRGLIIGASSNRDLLPQMQELGCDVVTDDKTALRPLLSSRLSSPQKVA